MSGSMLLFLAVTADAKKPKVYTAVRIDVEGKPGLCPGDFQKLDLFATEGGKETKVKFGAWKEFAITWDIGAPSPKGGLEMPLDPESTWGKPGALSVVSSSDPKVHAEAALPVRYDCDIVLDRSGETGVTGEVGERGSTAADAPGGDGQDGADGGDGGDGADLEVRVFLTKEPVRGVEVLQVAVKDLGTGESWNSAVAANGGRLEVRSFGGTGGSGGAGGTGGSGATGYDGGNGGDGGDGGVGGKGGQITVVVDPSAEGRLDALVLDNAGGMAGGSGASGDGGQGFDPGAPGKEGHTGHDGQPGPRGPVPAIRVEPVGALW